MPSRVPMNRLSFRVTYGVMLPFPNPVFQCPGEGAKISPGLGEAIARDRSEGEPRMSLPLSVPGAPSPRMPESLRNSDLRHVVVGEQALLAP